jgi:hypothetical protein
VDAAVLVPPVGPSSCEHPSRASKQQNHNGISLGVPIVCTPLHRTLRTARRWCQVQLSKFRLRRGHGPFKAARPRAA